MKLNELIKLLFNRKTEAQKCDDDRFEDRFEVDGTWHTYYVCPNCRNFEREYINDWAFLPHAMGGSIVPNGIKEFSNRGCCNVCGMLRRNWVLKIMRRKGNGEIETREAK